MAKHFYELILLIKQKCQQNENEIMDQLEISQAEFNAFLVLREQEEIQGNEMAERMNLSPSRSSRVINTMVKKKYIHSSINKKDRRSLNLILTKKGIEIKKRIDQCFINCETNVLSKLSSTEAEKMLKALNRLVEVF